MKKLMEPMELGELHLSNRLVRSATWEAMAPRSGEVTSELAEVYGKLAKGGVGAIITGFTSVAENDRYFGGMARLSDDALIPGHAELTRQVHENGTPVIAQLALGAYYRQDGRQVEPDRMTEDDIAAVVGWFAEAARRAHAACYDGVQIHLAHFFFLSRFVSPAHNHRLDGHGLNARGRARIALEILAAIRKAAPGLHVGTKVNSDDLTGGGLNKAAAMELCLMLDEAGIDHIEVSANGTSHTGVKAGRNEGYFMRFAAELAECSSAPVICVGGWRSMEAMQEALDSTEIAALSLSRPLVREPGLPNRWASGDTAPSRCVSCNACYTTPNHACIFNLREER